MNTSEGLFFSELLQQFRTRKRLNQKQLAKQIGVSRETISLWERGYYKPDTDTILYELGRVLGLIEQEQQQLFEAYTITALAASFHNPPLERNPYFTGRNPQLANLHTLLMVGKQVALTQAISGLGGIGKTQLALEYAYRYQKSYHDIFWTVADTYESLMASYVRLASLLRLSEYEEPDQSKVKEAVQRWLSKHTGWLLILDNIEDLSLVHQFVPVDRQGAVLLTTRRQVTERVAQALELGTWPEHHSILFLLKRTKILTLEMSLDDAAASDIAAARMIARALGNLPLALDQAGAYILETRCSLSAYLDLFRKHQGELLRRRTGGEIPTDHPESVATTFTLNFQQVQRNEIAAELLRVCAFLASDGIGEEIFVQGASGLGPILQPLSSDGLLLNQAIEVLRTFSLIQRGPEEKTLSIHRLVQAVIQDAMTEPENARWRERVIRALNTVFPEGGYEVWTECERLLPHVLIYTISTEQSPADLELAHVLRKAADYLSARAQYAEAEPLYMQVLRIRVAALGPKDLLVAATLNHLAALYFEQGKYAAVEPLYELVLGILRTALGLEHPSTTYPLNGLANLYRRQGRYVEAGPLFQQALAIWEATVGPEHPNVATSLNNLAALYKEQGRYAEAERLYQRALAIWEAALGSEHTDVAHPLQGLAVLYSRQGKYADAEPLYQRALAIREQRLGPEHPDTRIVRENYVALLRMMGRDAEATALDVKSQ